LDDQFIEKCKQIKNDYGYEIFSNLGLVNSLMADYAKGEYYKERRLLVWVLESNCQNTLTAEQEYNDWKERWIKRLNTEEYIDKDRASWALDRIFELLIAESYYTKRGFLLIEKDNLNDAEKLFNKTIEINKNSSDAFHGKGIITSKKGDFEKAIKYLTKSIKYNPANEAVLNKQLAQVYNARGNLFFDKQNYLSAISDYEKSKVLCPDLELNNLSLLLNRGQAYFHIKNYSNTIKDCTKALEIDKTDIKAYELQSHVYYSMKRYDLAIEDNIIILNIDPQNARAFYHLSLIYLEINNFTESRKNINNANKYNSDAKFSEKINKQQEKLNTRESVYYENLGDNFANEKKSSEAIDTYSLAINLTPNNSRIYHKRGKIFLETENFQTAKIDFEIAKKLSIEPIDRFINNGFLSFIGKDYSYSIEQFNNVIKLDSSYTNYVTSFLAKAYQEIGNIFYKKENYDEAIHNFESAIKFDISLIDYIYPFLAHAYKEAGYNLLSKKYYDEAINYFENAIRVNSSQKEILQPIIFKTYCEKAYEMKERNDFKSAIDCYEKALAINSDNNLLIEMAKCNHMLSNYQLEIELYTKLILSDPENTELYIYRAETYSLIKDYDKALDDYNTILEKNKDDSKAYIKRSYVHYLMGNIEAFFVDYSILKNRYNIIFINEDDFSIFFKQRETWEGETGYIENTKFPFKCANCSYFDKIISICKKMKEINAFPITSDGSRCREYKKA